MSRNVVHQLYSAKESLRRYYSQDTSKSSVHDCLKNRFIEELPGWSVCKTESRFKRRITCIQWHPYYHNAVAFGSHGGDIHLCFPTEPKRDLLLDGEGFGGYCITQMIFNSFNPSFMYTTSISGCFTMRDLEGRHSEVYLDTQDLKYWWTSLAISTEIEVIFVGGNTGKAVLLDLAGNIIIQIPRLHKEKIHDADISPACPWLLATSSNDRTVRLWDVRMMTNTDMEPSPLAVLKHMGPINSAIFDPIHGSSLLTTTQNNEVRVYQSYNWEEPTFVITHTHRHYQHMTNIRATWHPLYRDLCIVGKYPEQDDPDQSRYIDVIDTKEGKIVGQLYDPAAQQITVLGKFNKIGDALATGMGYTVVLWSQSKSGEHSSLGKLTTDRLLSSKKTRRQNHKRKGKDCSSVKQKQLKIKAKH